MFPLVAQLNSHPGMAIIVSVAIIAMVGITLTVILQHQFSLSVTEESAEEDDTDRVIAIITNQGVTLPQDQNECAVPSDATIEAIRVSLIDGFGPFVRVRIDGQINERGLVYLSHTPDEATYIISPPIKPDKLWNWVEIMLITPDFGEDGSRQDIIARTKITWAPATY